MIQTQQASYLTRCEHQLNNKEHLTGERPATDKTHRIPSDYQNSPGDPITWLPEPNSQLISKKFPGCSCP
uniref:Uncharacterized protein n=1 Tax=Arundo donax TaxID=35708 RepID=A0A0A9GTF2_ARUDO